MGAGPDGEEGGKVGGFWKRFSEEPVELAKQWVQVGTEWNPRRWLVFCNPQERGRPGDPYVTEYPQSSQKAKGLALSGSAGAGLLEVVAPGLGKAHVSFRLRHKALRTGASYAQGVGCGWD